MPPLPNARWERFAQAIARGEPKIKAHEDAGYKPHGPNAHALAKKQNISARIAELLAENQAIHEQAIAQAVTESAVDKTWILNMLRSNVLDARAAGDFAPANAALALLGKAIAPGMFAEHTVGTVTAIDGDLERMTPDERRAEAERLARELGLDAGPGGLIGLDGGLTGGKLKRAAG